MIQQATRAVPRLDLGVAFHEYDPSTDGFIADQVLPPLPVEKKAATLSVITRENRKVPNVNHANGGTFNRVVLTSEDMDYVCKDRGLEGQLTDEDRGNYASDYDAEYETSQLITQLMYLAREKRVKAAVFNTTTWDTSTAALYTDNSGTPWDTTTTNIISQVEAAMEKVRLNTGVRPDSMVIGEAAMCNIRKNTVILARFPGATTISRKMIEDNLGALFGLSNLIVGGQVEDSAKEGQSFSASDIWGDDYALIFKKAQGSMASPGLGRQPEWTGVENGLSRVVQYREEQTESDIFRVRDFSTEKIFDPFFGHLMKIDA
jgi:hypothetical protein